MMWFDFLCIEAMDLFFPHSENWAPKDYTFSERFALNVVSWFRKGKKESNMDLKKSIFM